MHNRLKFINRSTYHIVVSHIDYIFNGFPIFFKKGVIYNCVVIIIFTVNIFMVNPFFNIEIFVKLIGTYKW
ncbi:hypothetical protein LY90DRAFT_275113 [Neocallimastix californiae]|uniref:Uncharacterized protein n=1 Tax=Neocallimastix californiae TaxID=1754190 RepID=A0A1Y2D5C8_9FUNG|nr:hypothetical protein LY90DRAFT_275113 [Neocallimastix californiae]|eukprot:ORY54508.1 hypothetical protein LY90DRAFT_275113 [Neocallimastix californiae]